MMASPSKIIEERELKGLPVSQQVRDVYDTTGGLTDELYNLQMMKALGEKAPYYLENSDYYPEAPAPTLDRIVSALGITDKDGKKAYERFIEDFPKKAGEWKTKLTRNEAFGERGWQTAQDLWRTALHDKMLADTKQAREDIASGKNEEGLDWLRTKAANLLYPRITKAVEEGRDPYPSDYVGDFGSQALYAVPWGKVLGATGTLGSLGANVIAPSAVAAYDYATSRGTPHEMSAGQAVFQGGLGSLTNLGVNKYVAPWLGNVAGTAAGKISTKMTPAVRAFFEPPMSSTAKASQVIANAKNTLKAPTTASAATLDQLAMGSGIVTDADRKAARAVLDIAEQAAKPDVKKATSRILSTGKFKPEESSGVLASLASGSKNRIPYGDAMKMTTGQRSKILNQDKQVFQEAIEKNPSLASLFKQKDPRVALTHGSGFSPSQILKGEILTRGLGDVAKTEVLNQIGNNEPEIASSAARRLGVNLDELQKKIDWGARQDKVQSQIGKILSKGSQYGLDSKDMEYLSAVAENADVVTEGYPDDPEGFKSWLITRGHKLLENTDANKPIWETKASK
jgi:hypothetical protein